MSLTTEQLERLRTLQGALSALSYEYEDVLPHLAQESSVKDGNDTAIGMLKDQTNGLAAIKSAVQAGGGSVYPTIQMTATTAAIDPNKVYIWGEVASLTITFNAGQSGVANVYFLEFYSGATATTLTLPASVTEVRGSIASNAIVNVGIFNGIAYIA